MRRERIAVIDLGSNTFHLLICEVTPDGNWYELHKEREYVKLGSGGIDVIDPQAEQRALDAMNRFAGLIQQHGVSRVKAIGTAALRDSENGIRIADKISDVTGIEVEIINGHQEAHYILEGIRSAIPDRDEYRLIMDIGGGSVEFILYKLDDVLFAGSFRIGMAVLFQKFHHSDPISAEETDRLEQFLDDELGEIIRQLSVLDSYYLVGASGAFEVLREELPKKADGDHWAELDMSDSLGILDKVIGTSLAERRLMPEIPEERQDYIVVAYILIRYLLVHASPAGLYYCDYALKEGVIESMINDFRQV